MSKLPNVHFGSADAAPAKWRAKNMADMNNDSDAELKKTPDDIVKMLGFDPKEFSVKHSAKLVKAVQTTEDEFAFPEFQTLESNIEITKSRIESDTCTRVWLRENRIEIYREHSVKGIERYFAVDIKADPKVTLYCVRLDYTYTKPLRAGCQVGVWAETNNIATVGIAKDVFWKILFKSHDMITDSMQTAYGQRFWQNRLKEAFEFGYNVYSIQFTNRDIKNAKSYAAMEDLEKDFNKLWGSKVTDRSRRLLITLEPMQFKGYQEPYEANVKTKELATPKAWNTANVRQKIEAKTQVKARIDMSAEVAGAGLCPECKHPMEKAFTNGIECYVCHPDRIAIPCPDSQPEAGIEGSSSFGPTTAQEPV